MVDRCRAARALGCTVLSLGVLLGTAGCGGDALSASATASSSTTTAAETTTSSSAPATTSAAATTAAASTSSGGPLTTESAGRPLHLTDFFMPGSDWQEKRYDVADKSQVQGIGTTVANCGSYYAPQELELRLANNFHELTFTVGQANDSRASDQAVSVEVLANNAQVEIRSVPFNQLQQFTIPVTGVNALKIDLRLDEDVPHCGTGSVVAVLTDVQLS